MDTSAATTSTGRKLLLPLATLAVAGAVAVGSGATWTDQVSKSISVTGGTLDITSTTTGAVMSVTNIRPGDSMSGTVVVKNTGNLASDLALEATVAATAPGAKRFAADALQLKITVDKDGVGSGTPAVVFDSTAAPTEKDFYDATGHSAQDFAVDAEWTYVFTVSLDSTSANVDQGALAGATFTWAQTQKSGSSSTFTGF